MEYGEIVCSCNVKVIFVPIQYMVEKEILRDYNEAIPILNTVILNMSKQIDIYC